MADWSQRFKASYRVMRVSRETGDEVSKVAGILDGGEIDRNQDTATFESGSLDYAGGFDVGTDLVRVYLEAEFPDGSRATEALGTFLAQAPESSVDGSLSRGSVVLYGRLKELADDDFDHPYQVGAGSNAVQAAARICKESGLEVVAEPSDFKLASTWTFGTGAYTEDDPDDKLAAVNALLAAAGFSSAQTDPYGRVLMRRYVEPSSRPVAMRFAEGATARFLSAASRSFDKSSVANVVHADFSSQDGTVRGTAVDDDPKSPFSVQAAGRRIAKRYEYSGLPDGADAKAMQAAADAKARELLDTERSAIDRVTFDHVYAPVRVGDAVEMDYPSAGIGRKLAVRTQRLTLGAGCLVRCEARAFER